MVPGDTRARSGPGRAYNGFGELVSQTASFGGAEILRIEYVLDKLGRISRKTERIFGTTALFDYTYDLGGRRLSVSPGGA